MGMRTIRVRRSDPWLLQFIEQRLGLVEVSRLEALGEPAVDRGEEVVRLGTPVLLGP
jgi:hypothetical protein